MQIYIRILNYQNGMAGGVVEPLFYMLTRREHGEITFLYSPHSVKVAKRLRNVLNIGKLTVGEKKQPLLAKVMPRFASQE